MSPPPEKKCKTGTEHDEVARLRAELEETRKENEKLEEKNEKLEEKNEMLEEKSEKLEEKNEMLEEKNEMLEEKREKLEEKNEMLNEEIHQKSLKTLVSMEKPLNLIERGSGKSHTGKTPKHKEAHLIKIGDKFELASFHSGAFAKKITEKDWRSQSSLLVDFKGSTEEEYSSEADISRFVESALRDAAQLASIVADRKFKLRNEMSFFSQRPDHLVVFDPDSGTPLIAVEDKKPFDGNLENENHVLGQIFDYTTAMKAFGHATPFVILTTFEKSSMFWLADSKSKHVAANVHEFLERSFGQTASAESGLSATGTKKKTPSPPDLKAESWENFDGNGNMFVAADGGNRKLIGTEEYKSNLLVQLMCTAILCSAAANPCAEQKHEILSLQAGSKYKGGALEMTSDDYSWGTLQATVGTPIPNQPEQLIAGPRTSGDSAKAMKGDCRYYVIGIIGAGDTSKVFHALDASGNECVIKMYAKRVDDERKLTLSKKDFESKAEQATERELENYKLLYPKISVKKEKIYNHFCVVIPFFRPIKKEERSMRLEAIEEELKRIADQGRKFKKDDVRWRHVGLHGEKDEIVLFDLADLEMTTENDENDFTHHAGILKERIS